MPLCLFYQCAHSKTCSLLIYTGSVWIAPSSLKGFAGYGFPESHSASFALLAYVSSWLKCHHPAAFFAGLLNSQPMGFYSPSQLVQDARRHGVVVLPADVNHSNWDHQLLPARDGGQPPLRLGLRLVHGLSREGAGRVISASCLVSVVP